MALCRSAVWTRVGACDIKGRVEARATDRLGDVDKRGEPVLVGRAEVRLAGSVGETFVGPVLAVIQLVSTLFHELLLVSMSTQRDWWLVRNALYCQSVAKLLGVVGFAEDLV